MVSKAYPEFLPGCYIVLLPVRHGLGHLTWCCSEEETYFLHSYFTLHFMITVAELGAVAILWSEKKLAKKCLKLWREETTCLF